MGSGTRQGGAGRAGAGRGKTGVEPSDFVRVLRLLRGHEGALITVRPHAGGTDGHGVGVQDAEAVLVRHVLHEVFKAIGGHPAGEARQGEAGRRRKRKRRRRRRKKRRQKKNLR